MDSVSPPEPGKDAQPHSPQDAGGNEQHSHRIEANAYICLFFWIFADVLVIFGHTSIAVWIFYFVLIIALGLFTYHASQGWPTSRRKFAGVFVLSAILLPIVLLAVSHSQKSSQSIPQLELVLNTSHSPKRILMLTNDFLISSNNAIVIGESNAYVSIPIANNETGCDLNFSIGNGSDTPAEGVEMQLMLPQMTNCFPDPQWAHTVVPPYSSGTGEMQCLIWHSSEMLLHNSGIPTPRIAFIPAITPKQIYGEIPRIPIHVMMRAKDTPQIIVSFWLVFMHFDNFVATNPPVIIRPEVSQDASGSMHIILQSPTNR